MDLKQYDGKCVRITTRWDEVFEGICSYNSAEYCDLEFGREEDCLQLVCFIFYESDIQQIVSLEDHSGPYGRFSEPYGFLEESSSVDGTVLIEEFFDSEEPEHIVRMLRCLRDRLCGKLTMPENISSSDFEEWLGEELRSLIDYNDDDRVRAEAESLLEALSERFQPETVSDRNDPEKISGICGLFCGSCPAYLAFRCDGCLSDHVEPFCRECRHGFRECAKEHGVTWCFQCLDFPCDRQRSFKDSHIENGISHHEHVMEEILRQRELGLEAWVKEQVKLNSCPSCGASTAWLDRRCRSCGAELPR